MSLEKRDLSKLIFCPGCQKIHAKHSIKDGTDATCASCNLILYRKDSHLLDRGLTINITALIFLGIATAFPLVSIEILGSQQSLTIFQSISHLFENGYYIIGVATALFILLIPLIVGISEISALLLLKRKKHSQATRYLLILLSKLQPWGMSEVYLISILITLIKLLSHADINIGISFWALAIYAMINLYNIKVIHISELWSTRDNVFGLVPK
ncbi:MAG: paraquat-inducible protein A [Ghiorsea sp.]